MSDSNSAMIFVRTIPCCEEDMRATVSEIIRIHSDLPPLRPKTNRISFGALEAIRDNLQHLVDMITEDMDNAKKRKINEKTNT